MAVVQWKGAKMKATTKDLRFRTKELLETVSRGEEVVITYRGKPCAKLIPFEKENGKNTQNDLFGMWKDHDKFSNVNDYVGSIRKERFQ